MIDLVFRTGKNYYLQVILEECKYVDIGKKMLQYTTNNIEISVDDSVREDPDEENSDKENFDRENFNKGN